MQFANNQASLEIAKAILLYTGMGGEIAYASIHRVDKDDKGPMRIAPGRAVTEEAIEQAVKGLAKSAGVDLLQWSDDSVVATAPTLSCWWTPAQRRWMHFQVGNFVRSGEAQQPALVWILQGATLYVFALKENTKPTAATMLYDSPYLNVYQEGNVCTGSMSAGPKTSREGWVDAFFGSRFTHANPANRKLTSHPGSNLDLWNKRMDSPEKPFPVSCLKSHKTTLGDLLKDLST